MASGFTQFYTLQWGRDSLVAEICTLMNKIQKTKELQWGRDSLVAEIAGAVYEAPGAIGTSMGPRLVSRGNNVNTFVFTNVGTGLQWGRDSLVAEINCYLLNTRKHLSLQWGRDSLVAEILSPAAIRISNWILQWGRDSLVAEIHPTQNF